jgi:hypothetical protein
MGYCFFIVGFNIVFLFFCALGLNFEAINLIKRYVEAFGSILGVWDPKMSEGICRLKYYLAKILGHDIDVCDKTTSKIMRIEFDSLEEKDKNKNDAVARKVELSFRSSTTSAPEGQGSGRGSIDSGIGRLSPFFPTQTTLGAQPSIRSFLKKKEKKEEDRVVGRCLFWSNIPLSITKNNPFWQPMYDAITVVGPGYKIPTFEELQRPILQEEKKDINSRLAEFKKSWEI